MIVTIGVKELRDILNDQFTGLTFGWITAKKRDDQDNPIVLSDDDEIILEVTGY